MHQLVFMPEVSDMRYVAFHNQHGYDEMQYIYQPGVINGVLKSRMPSAWEVECAGQERWMDRCT